MKGGGAPLWCSAARRIVRNAKQKKGRASQNSEAFFGGPRFTRPLRAGKRANANFACSEGFFCAQCAAPCGGLAVLCAACRCCGVFCDRCSGVFFRQCVAALVPNRRAGHRFLFGLRWPPPGGCVRGLPAGAPRVLWLCSRPACRAACRFCSNFRAHCPFACHALCFVLF